MGSLALGIAVDDTIHFFARFNSEAKRAADERKGVQGALRALIRPVTFTTIGLVLGFGVLTFSELGSQVQFGLLSALTIAVAWLVDVTLSPALCSGVRIVTLWDVLRLDLGEAPHKEIPLFQDLSLRQTRIFALMADIRRMQAGERLVTEGEAGNDMFVIVDGTLRAWVERDGAEVELSTMPRGSVVGEVAYFASKRTANVDAEQRRTAHPLRRRGPGAPAPPLSQDRSGGLPQPEPHPGGAPGAHHREGPALGGERASPVRRPPYRCISQVRLGRRPPRATRRVRRRALPGCRPAA